MDAADTTKTIGCATSITGNHGWGFVLSQTICLSHWYSSIYVVNAGSFSGTLANKIIQRHKHNFIKKGKGKGQDELFEQGVHGS